jgi:hypothetical protein
MTRSLDYAHRSCGHHEADVRGPLSRRFVRFAAIPVLAWAGLVHAHHSTGVFDTARLIELRGTIVDFKLRNPHASLVVDARIVENGNPGGPVLRWEVESESVSMLRTLGIDEQTFEPGDAITIHAWRSRDPAFRFAHARTLVDAFGAEYEMARSTRLFSPSLRAAASRPAEQTSTPSVEAGPVAQGIRKLAGRWQQPLLRFEAGVPALPLNAAGLAAWRAYERKRSPANRCEPINLPDLFFQPFFIFEVQIDAGYAVLHNEVYDIVRALPLDGTEIAVDPEGWFGVARARVEGDTLVVESRGFRPSAWGLGGEEAHGGGDVPSSDKKTLTERFSISPDERTLFYDYTLGDPAYLAEPKRGHVELTRVPAATSIYAYACDLESAGMWSRTRDDAPLRVTPPP